MTEISNYAKYRVSGPGAEAWLSSLLTARMPAPGRITLTAMLNEPGGSSASSRSPGRPRRTSSTCSARCRRRSITRAGSGTTCRPTASVRFEVLGLGLTGLSVAGPRSRDVLPAIAPDLDLSTEAFPFMTFRRVDLGHDPGPSRPDQLRRRPRLRAVGRAGVPARAVRPDRGGRRAARPAPVRHARADVAPAREELRDVVPRVPADLHAARGAGSPATSGSTTTSSAGPRTRPRSPTAARSAGSSTFVVEPDPDDPADVIGDEPVWHDGAVVGWVTSGGYGHHVKAVDRARLRADRAGDRRTAPAATASRSRSSGGAGRRGSSRSRCSTRRVCGCASDRRRRATRIAGGSSSTAAPIAFQPGDSVAIAILRAGEQPARGGTLCLAGDCGNCLAEVDGIAYVRTCQAACAARAGGRAPSAEGLPPLPVVGGTDVTARRRARRSRSHGARSTSPSSVAARAAGPRPRPPRRPGSGVLVLDAARRRRGRRRSTRARSSSPGRRRGMLHVRRRARSSSRPAPPRSSRSARATSSPGS